MRYMKSQKLIVTDHDGLTTFRELFWDADADDFVDAFFRVMVGSGFHQDSVLDAMSEFVLMMDDGSDHEGTDGRVRL